MNKNVVIQYSTQDLWVDEEVRDVTENGTVATRRCQNSKNMTRFYMVPEELKLP